MTMGMQIQREKECDACCLIKTKHNSDYEKKQWTKNLSEEEHVHHGIDQNWKNNNHAN